MLRTPPAALATAFVVLALLHHHFPEPRARAVGPGWSSPRQQMPVQSEFSGNPARFEHCALNTRLSEAELRSVRITIAIDDAEGVTVTLAEPSALPGAAALTSCLQREVEQVVRTIPGRVRPGTVDAFPSLDLPMDPPPPDASRVLSPHDAVALVGQLVAAESDSARMALLRSIESSGAALPTSHARAALSAFVVPHAMVGGLLCRVVTGRGALAAVRAGVQASERTRFRLLTRGRCGVGVQAP